MGRHCGFEFYRLIDGQFVEAKVAYNDWLSENENPSSWLQIDGRCEATTIFLNLVLSKENWTGFFHNKDLKPEEKYTAYLLLNHPELDGFVRPWKIDEYDKEHEGWFSKYFYMGLESFISEFDFEQAQKDHDRWISDLKTEIRQYKKEIESLRVHQEKAKTEIAFNKFEDKINELKENIAVLKASIKEIQEDDYDYEHFMRIKMCIDQVEQIVKDYPDVIVVAFAND